MTPQELKNSILQLAIQGKLVEQRADEGTGAELLEEILAAKSVEGRGNKLTRSRGVRGGGEDEGISNLPKVAKSHPENPSTLSALSASPREEISDDEKPFDIPESWEWVHINQIAETSLGKTMDKAKNTGDLCPYMCSINVYWDGISLEKVKEARFSADDKAKYFLRKGDLLICEGGDVGRAAIWNLDKEMYYQNALHRVRFHGNILPTYFKLIIECYKGLGIIDRYCKGVTIKHLVQNSLHAIWFPLPPLAEQKRIVAKIEELLPLVDRYEKAWSRLEDFNKRFPVDMQKSLLQMAIQGKLVEQRPEEGTAAELLEKIFAAKNAKDAKKNLTQRRRVRGENATSALSASPREEIPDDEKPFDIPESWEWVRLGEVCRSISDGDHQPPPQVERGIPFLVISNVSSGTIDFTNTRHVPESYYMSLSGDRIAEKDDILFTVTGSYGIPVKVETTRKFCFQRHIALLKPLIDRSYLIQALKSPAVKLQCDAEATGTAQKTVGLKALRTLLIPIPPLAEQKRIVAKLEELLPLCERLKSASESI